MGLKDKWELIQVNKLSGELSFTSGYFPHSSGDCFLGLVLRVGTRIFATFETRIPLIMISCDL